MDVLLAYCVTKGYSSAVNDSLCTTPFCRLVKGPTLCNHICARTKVRFLGSQQEYEQSMLDLGAQLVHVSGRYKASMRGKINRHAVLQKKGNNVVQSMERMHAVGVSHMDLSTDNVMVQTDTNYPSVKIIDFGLSRQIATGKTGCKLCQHLRCYEGTLSLPVYGA